MLRIKFILGIFLEMIKKFVKYSNLLCREIQYNNIIIKFFKIKSLLMLATVLEMKYSVLLYTINGKKF